MTVYEAIHHMRRLSALGETFSVSFMTYSQQRNESHGEVTIEHATLIKHATDNQGAREHMLTLHDHDTNQTRSCWQPLLLSFNHEPLTAID